MTNPETMRWKLSPSKNPLSARYLNDPPVLGARLASSVISKVPQLVLTVATYVFAGSSCSLGLGSETFFGGGCSALGQPSCSPPVSSGVSVAVAFAAAEPPPPLSFLSPPPQPANTPRIRHAMTAIKGSPRGGIKGPGPAPPRRCPLRPRAPRPRRLPVGGRGGARGRRGGGGRAAGGGEGHRVHDQRRPP